MNGHNGPNGNQSSREIEQEVERTRAHMAETLDELRERMSPGQILDEVIGYTKDSGGGQMMRNLGRTVQDNPAPLLLIGAGVAWMMATSGPRRARAQYPVRRSESGSSDWSDGVDSAYESARRAGAAIGEGVSSATDTISGTAADLRDSAMRGAEDLRDAASARMRDAQDAAYRTGDAVYRRGRDLGSSLANMMNEQPFVLGALGLALGAALGAVLPETEVENRLMGEASDSIKDKAAEAAAAGYEKVKTVAEIVADRASKEAQAQGLTTENARAAMADTGSKVTAVFETSKDAAVEEASKQRDNEEAEAPTAADSRPFGSSQPRAG